MKYWWLILVLVSLLGLVVGDGDPSSTSETAFSPESELRCANLLNQIRHGRWKKYDWVMDDCLIKKFIRVGGPELDFRSILATLEQLTKRNEQLRAKKLIVNQNSGKTKLELELELRANKRSVSRRKSELDAMLADDTMKVWLLETDIRCMMDRCSLNPVSQSSKVTYPAEHADFCSKTSDSMLERAKQLCAKLRTRAALLLSDTLQLEAIEALSGTPS